MQLHIMHVRTYMYMYEGVLCVQWLFTCVHNVYVHLE